MEEGGLMTGHRAVAPATDRTPLLHATDVRVTYRNGATGVAGADLTVQPGQIVAVVGRNGAGKTSTLRAIAGFLRSEHVKVTGSVRVRGQELAGRPPNRSFRAGVTLVAEREKVFPELTVQEHLRLVWRAGADTPTRFPALEALRPRRAGLLSGGERQMLALELACRHKPSLMLVDELSLGLAPVVIRALMPQLRELVDATGAGMVLVEQDIVNALHIADYVYVLDYGVPVWQGPAGHTSAEELGRRFLGAFA
jgi:ABC-type branched-subunit amino acid transport system ATPase component